MQRLIECVPNISEGRRPEVINAVASVVETVDGCRLLDVDPGKSTNRTVITFVGPPETVGEAAFRLIKKASELIDMSKHSGEHPRMGATDVCPFVPVAGVTMEDCIKVAHEVGERVGKELNIPGYFYESAAKRPERKNLAVCRKGQYEGLGKLSSEEGAPDFGPAEFNDAARRTGATAVGARDFLIAYNINLNTTSSRRANAIAFDIREAGRIKKRDGITGPAILDEHGEPVRIPGTLKSVKGIGWYIEEYGIAQLSLNLTDINVTPVHVAFDEACDKAQARGIRVTGSELVGLLPLRVLLDAADHYLRKQQRSLGISEEEKVKIAVKSLGLDDLAPFDPAKRVIEYIIAEQGELPTHQHDAHPICRHHRIGGTRTRRRLHCRVRRRPWCSACDHGGQPQRPQAWVGRPLGRIQRARGKGTRPSEPAHGARGCRHPGLRCHHGGVWHAQGNRGPKGQTPSSHPRCHTQRH